MENKIEGLKIKYLYVLRGIIGDVSYEDPSIQGGGYHLRWIGSPWESYNF